jgi:hypothetical protein
MHLDKSAGDIKGKDILGSAQARCPTFRAFRKVGLRGYVPIRIVTPSNSPCAFIAPLLRRSSPQKRTRRGDVIFAYRLANPNLN